MTGIIRLTLEALLTFTADFFMKKFQASSFQLMVMAMTGLTSPAPILYCTVSLKVHYLNFIKYEYEKSDLQCM